MIFEYQGDANSYAASIVHPYEEYTASSIKQGAGISARRTANYSWFLSVSCWRLSFCLAMANADRIATYITSSVIAIIQLVLSLIHI